jgi:hypothetical protein
VSSLDSRDLTLGEGGTIEIIVSVEKPKDNRSNWLRLAADPPEGLIIVRQTFLDQKNEIAAQITIERIQTETQVIVRNQSSLTSEKLESALQNTALFVTGASLMFSNWARGFQRHTNQLPLFDQKTSNKFVCFHISFYV